MLKLYLLSLRRTLGSHKALLLFILLGITAAMFCISITLGSARDAYENSIDINYLSQSRWRLRRMMKKETMP